MGCGSSVDSKSKAIDQQLQEDDEDESSVIKLLLLGPGESGKSTILKQMQIIHTSGLKIEDKLPYKSVIYTNVLNALYIICTGAKQFQIEFSDLQNEATAAEFIKGMESFDIGIPFDTQFYSRVKTLISETALIAQIFEHQTELQIEDSAKYFLDQLDRLQNSDYIPSEEDILKARASTTGIVEVKFEFRQTTFKVFDVGGQKSERRKWIHCFDNVTTLIFMVAISEYDRTLREDRTTNRMTDALQLFESIANVRWFHKKDIILFLNKTDLFRQKIGRISLKTTFPEFTGIENYETGLEFMKQRFLDENKNKQRMIKTHPTCATDTTQVKSVIDGVISTLIDKLQHV